MGFSIPNINPAKILERVKTSSDIIRERLSMEADTRDMQLNVVNHLQSLFQRHKDTLVALSYLKKIRQNTSRYDIYNTVKLFEEVMQSEILDLSRYIAVLKENKVDLGILKDMNPYEISNEIHIHTDILRKDGYNGLTVIVSIITIVDHLGYIINKKMPTQHIVTDPSRQFRLDVQALRILTNLEELSKNYNFHQQNSVSFSSVTNDIKPSESDNLIEYFRPRFEEVIQRIFSVTSNKSDEIAKRFGYKGFAECLTLKNRFFGPEGDSELLRDFYRRVKYHSN
jgi:hypothetical protein